MVVMVSSSSRSEVQVKLGSGDAGSPHHPIPLTGLFPPDLVQADARS
jgi:hypothetical protein